MTHSATPHSEKGLSRDRVKLYVAIGLFSLAGIILVWQLLLPSGGRTADPEIEAQQQAILEQMGESKSPPPAPNPYQTDQHGRGPRSVNGR